MLQGVTTNLTHPEAVMYTVATALFYPILLLLTGALFYLVFELGAFTFETVRRDRKRSLGRTKAAAMNAQLSIEAHNPVQAVAELARISDNWLVVRFVRALGSGEDLSPGTLLKQLVEAEMRATQRLDRTRVWIRLGPIIGLITTLIPISPALVALAKGDLEVLSANLVIAFSTTVISLFISGLAFVISVFRERYYLQDLSDIEYALELLEE